jgi:hypothetical protein
MVMVSAASGLATVFLVSCSRFGSARVSAALAVAAIVGGWAFAQQPHFLSSLTVDQAAADPSTLRAVAISVAAGVIVLVPSLMLLFSLFLRGLLDAEIDPGAPVLEVPHPAARARSGVRRGVLPHGCRSDGLRRCRLGPHRRRRLPLFVRSICIHPGREGSGRATPDRTTANWNQQHEIETLKALYLPMRRHTAGDVQTTPAQTRLEI